MEVYFIQEAREIGELSSGAAQFISLDWITDFQKFKDKPHSYSKINNPEFHFLTTRCNITIILAGNLHSHPVCKNYSLQDDIQMPSRGTWGKYVHLASFSRGETAEQKLVITITTCFVGKRYCCMKQSPRQRKFRKNKR